MDTIEGAVAFYNGDAFNNSPAGQLLVGATGSGIRLDATQVVAVAAFLRAINALENVRAGDSLLSNAYPNFRISEERQTELLRRATFEIEDAVIVLAGANLHPKAANDLRDANALLEDAIERRGSARKQRVEAAQSELNNAQGRMVGL